MSVPVPTNTTCDIYRNGVAPPTAPSVAGVPCLLKNDWRGGQEAGDHQVNTLTWTHIMLVDAAVDIRDAYTGQETMATQDSVYIPDQNGRRYLVVFIEEVLMGTANAHKRVYLDRLKSGQENLQVILWAIEWKIPTEPVLKILKALDINSRRLANRFECN